MSAEINLAQLAKHLPEMRAALVQHRRFIIVPAAAVLAYFLFRDSLQDARARYFSHVYMKLLGFIDKFLLEFRRKMKEDLAALPSKDPQPHNDATLRILEIGMGAGSSLDFYPKSSRVIGLEPNPYFIEILEQKQKSHPELVRVIRGYAEDIAGVQDESVDVVVSTLTFCSVRDLDKAIKEVKRVLVKDGRLYLFEHVLDTQNLKRRLLQRIVDPLWSLYYDGCHLIRDVKPALAKNGFEVSQVACGEGFLGMYILGCKIEGYAVKK